MWDPILMVTCVAILFATLFWFVWTVQDGTDIGAVVTEPNRPGAKAGGALYGLAGGNATCGEMSVRRSKLLFEQLNGESYRKGFIDLTGQSVPRAESYAAREVEKWLEYETSRPLYFILGPGHGPMDSMSKMTKHVRTFVDTHYGGEVAVKLSRISNPGVLILNKRAGTAAAES